MFKQISYNEIYLLIKYIKSVLWRVAKCLSYIEEARCLKVNKEIVHQVGKIKLHITNSVTLYLVGYTSESFTIHRHLNVKKAHFTFLRRFLERHRQQ